jgi:hypothetical protein
MDGLNSCPNHKSPLLNSKHLYGASHPPHMGEEHSQAYLMPNLVHIYTVVTSRLKKVVMQMIS